MKAVLGALGLLLTTSVASGGFIFVDPPSEGNSWTLHGQASGSFDYIVFMFVSGESGSGPFAGPGISGFDDHSTGDPPPEVTTWSTVYSDSTFVVARGPESDSDGLGFDIHLEGVFGSVTFQGAAFLNGEYVFSTTVVTDGGGFPNAGLPDWIPLPGDLPVNPMTPLPLPAPVWLGSLGLLAVIAFRRKIL